MNIPASEVPHGGLPGRDVAYPDQVSEQISGQHLGQDSGRDGSQVPHDAGQAPAAEETRELATVRLRLDIAYDGTDFAGWAIQPGLRTVAGELAAALAVVLRAPVPLVVAGRTDAGVHATGQVAHIDAHIDALDALVPRGWSPVPKVIQATGPDTGPDVGPGVSHGAGCAGLVRRLAGLLPPDIRVTAVTPAPPGFDARFSALRRHYRYRVGTAEWGVDPLRRSDIWARRRALDSSAMRRSAAALLGLHDFAAYCRPREGATTIRELQRLDIHDEPGQVVIEVSADAFCHSMVRSLVGALVTVGEGRADVGAPAELLAGRRRTAAVRVAPAAGLTLIGVDYPAPADLAARNDVTRAVRPLLPPRV